MDDLAATLQRIDPAAAAPAVALLQRTPQPLERRVPLVGRARLGRWLPPATVAAVQTLLALDGGAGPDGPPGAYRAVAGAAPARPAWLSALVRAAWAPLEVAMRADLGRVAQIASGYRSPTYQALLLLWLAGRPGGDPVQVARAARSPAASEHCQADHHAVDLTASARPADLAAFAASDEYRWLAANAASFGFVQTYRQSSPGSIAEPWHWRHHP